MVIIKIRIYDRPRFRQGNQAGPVTKLNQLAELKSNNRVKVDTNLYMFNV